MKSFIKYLTESKKTYHFKVRLANCDLKDDKKSDIENALKQFDLVSMTAIKNHPPEERSSEFPKLGAVEVKDFDVELDYPTVDMSVRQAVAHAMGCDLSRVMVYTKESWEQRMRELDRITSAQKDKTVIGKDELKAEKKPADSLDFLKGLETRKYEFAGDKTTNAQTTNDLPQGNVSPVGSTRVNKTMPGKRK